MYAYGFEVWIDINLLLERMLFIPRNLNSLQTFSQDTVGNLLLSNATLDLNLRKKSIYFQSKDGGRISISEKRWTLATLAMSLKAWSLVQLLWHCYPPMWYWACGCPVINDAALIDCCWGAWPQTICQPTSASNSMEVSPLWVKLLEKHDINLLLWLIIRPILESGQSSRKLHNSFTLSYLLNNHHL